MTKATPFLKMTTGADPAQYAGVLVKTCGDLLGAAHDGLSTILNELELLQPLRGRLGEVSYALETARELNNQLTRCIALAALQGGVTGGGAEPAADSSRMTVPRKAAMVAMVVESNDGLRSLMGEVLRKQGYLVLEAGTAEEAERVAVESGIPVDTLITEVLIAGSSGVALGARLRVLQPQMDIVYTVCEAHEAVLPLEALGRAEVLKKPFTVAGLSGVLKGPESNR